MNNEIEIDMAQMKKKVIIGSVVILLLSIVLPRVLSALYMHRIYLEFGIGVIINLVFISVFSILWSTKTSTMIVLSGFGVNFIIGIFRNIKHLSVTYVFISLLFIGIYYFYSSLVSKFCKVPENNEYVYVQKRLHLFLLSAGVYFIENIIRNYKYLGIGVALFRGMLFGLFGGLLVMGIASLVFYIIKNQHEPKTIKEKETMDKDSYFDGGLLQLFGWSIAGAFITIITLGICYPWALCMLYGWKIDHTVVEGRRLKFHGKAISLFGHWLLWLLLCIITLGIYSLWLGIALEKWKAKNTTFADSNQMEKILDGYYQKGKMNTVEGPTKRCLKCGKRINEDLFTCPYCGGKEFD